MQNVLGQPRAIDLLQTSLQSGKLHHAFIFHGPPGVGKFTTAVGFAQILLCHQPISNNNLRAPCGLCPSCQLMNAGSSANAPAAEPPPTKSRKTKARSASATDPDSDDDGNDSDPDTSALNMQRWAHPDLHIVTKELARFDDEKSVRERKLITIPVEVLRRHLLAPAYRTAQLQHGKVFIIDEAQLIDLVGQNLLLKTLEEPPADHYFVLVTSQEDKLLPTIRSRCQRIPFVALESAILAQWLDRQSVIQKFSPTQRQWLIDFAGGSLGRLDLALRYELVNWGRELLPMLDQVQRDEFPLELGSTFARLIDEFALNWVAVHGKSASKEAANRLAANLLFTLISQWARRQMTLAADKAPAGDLVALDAHLDPWLQVIDLVHKTESQLAASLNLGLLCDHLALHLFITLRRLPKATA